MSPGFRWREGAPWPPSVGLAILAGVPVSLGAAAWLVSVRRVDLAGELVLGALATVLLYRATTALAGDRLRESARTGDWSRSAVVGLSARGGFLLPLYGALAFLVLVVLAQVPQWFLGVPEYAFSVEGAFAVMFLAPLREEVLMAALWGFMFTLAPGKFTVKFAVATAAATGVFMALHAGTYSGASDFAWVQLGAMRIIFSFAAFAPAFSRLPPSILPPLVAHIGVNWLFYFVECVSAGTGAAGIKAQFC